MKRTKARNKSSGPTVRARGQEKRSRPAMPSPPGPDKSPARTLATIPTLPEKIERVLLEGDLSALTPEERVSYYRAVCKSLRLNPLTRPLEYVKLNNRLVLYARRDCTDQLRALYNVKVSIVKEEERDGLRLVHARASLPNGRTDEDVGAVSIKGLSGDQLANALMRCTTKAKRRVTLSICGLGLLDETELETIHPTDDKPALVAEDVMPRRKPPEGEAGIVAKIEPEKPIQPAARSHGEAVAPQPEQKPGDPVGQRRMTGPKAEGASEVAASSSPSPQASLPLHAGVASPTGGPVVEINGRQIPTGGITKETLLKAYKFGAQLDELTVKGQAKELLGCEFGVEHRHELTEEAGKRYVAELVKHVNAALAARGQRA